MADKAHVTSVDVLADFRATLILYVSKARPAVEETSSEVLRLRMWLQNDQRMHWEGQVRRRRKQLEEAEQSLSSARMSDLREAVTVEFKAVQKAKHALEEAEAKLKVLKHWSREFDSRVEPLVKQLEKVNTVLANDMTKAATYLAHAANTLAAYAELAAPTVAPPPPPPADTNPLEDAASPAGGQP